MIHFLFLIVLLLTGLWLPEMARAQGSSERGIVGNPSARGAQSPTPSGGVKALSEDVKDLLSRGGRIGGPPPTGPGEPGGSNVDRNKHTKAATDCAGLQKEVDDKCRAYNEA